MDVCFWSVVVEFIASLIWFVCAFKGIYHAKANH